MKHGTINRSSSRTAKISRSGRGTYVKPPRMRHSVFVVRQALRGLAAFAAFQLSAPAALAGATIEGTVTSGQLNSITQPTPTQTNLNQGSKTLSMDLTVLDVPKGNTLNINQQAKDWLFVGRGVGNDPFRIYGTVNATGQVFLVNPQGVIFAPGSSVNVGGLVATTNDVRMEDGKYVFQNNGGTGTVVNQGRIYAPSGYAALIGPKVSNEGTIIARTVALAAGNRVALDMIGDGLISVRVEQAAVGAAALNSGTIIAEGGSVYLAARSADALLDTVVNNTGIIRANSLVERNGSIILDGGSHGVVANSGTLDVSGKEAGATGGTVKVLGEYVGLFNGSRIDASGDAGGGTVLVGGNFHGFGPEQNAKETYVASDTVINADAINSGNGGQVAIWSNNGTEFYGSVSARGGAQFGDGGFVEISGKDSLVFAGNVDTSAPNGRGGNLLLDPSDIFIIDGAATTGDLDATLAGSGNSTIVFTDGNVGGNTVTVGQLQAQGDTSITLQATNTIRVGTADGTTAANVDLSATLTTNTNTLTLSAGNGTGGAGNVTFNTGSAITTGGGNVAINAGQAGDTTGNAILGAIATSGGHITVTAQGSVSLVDAQNAGAGNVVITTQAGNITGAGVVTGNNVTLDSATGVGTSPADRVNTAANTLAARSRVSGGVFLAQAHAATLASIGGVTNTAAAGAPYNLTSGGLITIGAGGVNTGGTGATTLTTTVGGIALGANDVGNAGSATTLVSADTITGTTGVVHGTDVTLDSVNGVGTSGAQRLNTAADTLAARSTTSGSVFVLEADNVSLNTIGGVANSAAGSGAFIVAANGTMTVDGNVSTATGQITLTADSLINNAVISNGGTSTTANIALLANAFDLDNPGAAVNAGLAAAVLAPRTITNSFGIEDASAQTHVTNADIATVTGAAVVFGSPLPNVFIGNMTIGVDAQVQGGTKNLAFLRDPATATTGTITIGANGLTTTGNVAIGAGGHGSILMSPGAGTIEGNQVALSASDGIGTSGARVRTSATTLAVQNAGNGGSGAFVQETNDVTLANISLSAGGVTLNTTNTGGTGAYDVLANGGAITVGTGGVNTTGTGAGSTTKLATTIIGTNISLGTNDVGHAGSDTTLISGGNIQSTTGTVRGGNVALDAQTGIGLNPGARLNVDADVLAARVTLGGSVFIAEPNSVSINTLGGVTNTTLGTFDITAGGAITVDGNITGNAGVSLIAASITNNATIANNPVPTNSNILLRADAFDLDGTTGTGQVQGGASAVVLTPRNNANSLGVVSDGQTTIAQSDIDAIHTTNFVVFGSANQGFTGSTLIGQNALVDGGTKNLAFFRANPGPANTTTIGTFGVTSARDVIVNAGAGNILSNGGTVTGDHVQLRATTGIGLNTLTGRVLTDANTLAINNIANGAFVTEANNVSLNNVNLIVGGNINNAGNSGGNGGYSFIANGDISVDGSITTNNGVINLTGNSLTNHAAINNGGAASTSNIILAADAFSLGNLGASINSNGGATVLRPRTPSKSMGIEAAGDVTLTNADIASISTTNFLIFGSGSGAPGAFTGDMAIGVNNTVNGGTKNLSFLRDPTTVATTTIGGQGVTTTGNVIISAGAGNIVSQGGTISGNQIELRAGTGIGTALDRVHTSANTLAVQNQSGGAFVTEADGVTLADINQVAGGTASNAINTGGAGAYDIVAGGTITVGGAINTTGTSSTRLETTAGNISIGANSVGNLAGATTLVSAGNITGTTGVVQGADVTLDSVNGIGTSPAARLNTAANNLAARATLGGGVFVSEADTVTLATIGGVENLAGAAAAAYDVIAGGTITVGTGGVNIGGTGTTRLETTAGNIAIGHDNVGNLAAATTLIATGSITGPTGPGLLGVVQGTNVVLDSGTGVGSSTARVITAADTLAARSRTSGGVFVSEASGVSLNTIGTVANGAAAGGAYDVTANGAITVDGNVTAANGLITLDAATSLTNNATISNGGGTNTANIVLRANAYDLDGTGGTGQVQAGAAAVVLTPHTNTNSLGIVSAGDTTVAQSDLDAIHTTNFVALGSQNLGFVGNTTIGQNALVNGNGKSLAFLHALVGPVNTTTIGTFGVTTTKDVIINAGSGSIVSNGGTVTGDHVQLVAARGIGTSGARINTAANTLAANNAGAAGGIFISEANDVSLAAFSLLIGTNPTATIANVGGPGGYDLTAAGTITVGAGGVNTGVANTGATTLTTTGAGHNIDIGANNVGNLVGATTLGSAGSISGTTGVVIGSAVSLSAAGDIGAGEPNPLHVDAGTLNFNSPGAVTISESNDTVLTGANTAGSLTLLSTGSITDAPATSVNVAGDAIFFAPSITLADNGGDALTVGGQALFNSGALLNSGPISVGLGGAANFGTLRFTSTGGLVSIRESSDTVLDGGNNAETLVLSSTGSITNANGVSLRVAGNANLSGTSIDLGNAPVDFVHLTSLTFNSPGAVRISADEGTVLSGTSTAGSLNLIAGTITNAPGTSVTVATTANFTGTQITLANHADDVLSVGTDASFRATTSSLSIGEGGTANFGTLNFNSFLGASIHESSDTVLTGANAAPSLVLSSTGSLTDAPNTSLNVVGNASLSGASITLGDNAGDTTNFGTLTFNSTGVVSIHEGSDTVLSGTSTADSLILSSAGSITNEAGISLGVTNNANFSGTSITLGTSLGDGIDFGTLTFNSPGAVSIREASATVLSGASTADSLTLISTQLASITNAPLASLNVTQNANLSADSITLGNHPGDSINFGSLTFNSAGAVSISEASAMQITGTNTADSLALSSIGAITDAAGAHLTVTHNASFTGTSITLADSAADRLEVGDNASFNATVGGITIGDAGFVNFGSLTFNSPGAVAIQEDCCTLIAGINHAGSLNLTSSQGITNTDFAQITVDGNASFTGTSIILANNATNLLSVGGTGSFTATTGEITVGTLNVANFGFLNFKAPGTVSIREGSDTAITGNNTAGSLVLSSAGAITEFGTSLEVTGNANLSGTSINLGNNLGDTVNFGSLTFNSPGAVSISEDSATVLSGASTAGSLALTSNGSVSQQTGATLVVNGAANINAGSNPITLTNAGTDFVGTVTLKGTVTKVTDTNGISVMLDTSGDTVIIANGNLTSTGDLSLKGTTSGNLIGISNGGVLEWGAGGTPLTVGSNASPKAALLIAAQPNKTITGPGSAGNALDATTAYSKLANATGGTVNVPNGEFVLIADSLPRHPSSPDLPTITANTAVLKILGLTPGNRVTIQLNGQLRLLADKGVFRFTGTSVLPQGATSLDPKKVQLFIGNASITSAADELAARSAISAAQQSALNSASSDARQSFGTDSVTQQIDMGFAGDVGIAPTMAHNVPLQGEIISTPEGVTESKGGQ